MAEALEEAQAAAALAVKQAETALANYESLLARRRQVERAAFKQLILNSPEAPMPTGEMREYFVTFGMGYMIHPTDSGLKRHPAYPEHISGDGLIVIEAPSRNEAAMLAWVHFGDKFAGLYNSDPREFKNGNHYFARGEIGRMFPNGTLIWM